MLGLFRRDVYLQGGGHGGVNETVNDGGDLLLNGGLIAVGMTEVLHTGREKINVLTAPEMFERCISDIKRCIFLGVKDSDKRIFSISSLL